MDIFGALLNGATLCPFNVRAEGVDRLAEWLLREEITIYHSTPTVYRHLLNGLDVPPRFPRIRLVVLGGEEVYRRDFDQYREHFSDQCLFVNGLGPTESTLALQHLMDRDTVIAGNRVPVGFPVAETEVSLVNDAGEEVAVYGIGEIRIRSAHLATGYWRRPGLTAVAFQRTQEDETRRTYRTGDRGRRLPDGSIEFVGRTDGQIKIRGQRVEIEEIVTQLLRNPGVRSATVVADEEAAGERRLVAYVVPKEGHTLAAGDLYRPLAERLPGYMLPSAFVRVDLLPMLPNGKVDRRALPPPTPDRLLVNEAPAPPRTEDEVALAEIWSQLLGTHQVGIHDDFFALGGHSLLATQLLSRVRARFHAELPLRRLFETPTVAGLAEAIREAGESGPATPMGEIPRLDRERHRYQIARRES